MKRTLSWSQLVGITGFAGFVLLAWLGPLTVNHAPMAIDGERLMPPSAEYWLGTNMIGQDLYSQLIYGARTTLGIGMTVALLSTFLSVSLGLLAGYSHRLDPLLNGIANMLLVLPSLLLILIVASFTGGGTWQLILTLSLLTWPGYMRLIRASTLSLREREFVKAAQLYQGKTGYILRRHLLPFIWPLARTKFIIAFQTAVAMEASLAFLGIGDPSTVSWGRMLHEAFSRTQTFLTDAWLWSIVPPAAAILLVIVALALLGESSARGPSFAAQSGRRAGHQAAGQRADRGVADQPSTGDDAAPSRTADEAKSGEAAIVVRDLQVTYADRIIVHPISFEVRQGSITSLVGESGSGKTTLARAVYGLVPPVSVEGEARVNGRPIYDAGSAAAMERWVDAAFIMQDPRSSFNPILTIGQQFYEAMRRQRTRAERRIAAIAALEEVQLDAHVLSCYPHQLSGGMLSRALIALALVNKPRVLIADEPTGALDPLVKREVFDLLVAKVREHRMALLLITHDIPAARHISDEIIALREGRRVEAHLDQEAGRREPGAAVGRA